MLKYGTYIIYKCKKCKKEITVPLHQDGEMELEKSAENCGHDWEKIGESSDVQSDNKESKNV